MPGVLFENTTPAFERAKTVHGLDLAATVIGYFCPQGGCFLFYRGRTSFKYSLNIEINTSLQIVSFNA
jgi:hypothetical protein